MYPTREAVHSMAQQRRAQLMQQADAHRLARAAMGRPAVRKTTTVAEEHSQPRRATDHFGSVGRLRLLIKHRETTAATTSAKSISPPRTGRQAA
jgi:hypothetical protein